MPQDDQKNIEVTQERRHSFRIPLRVLKVSTDKSGREIFFGYAKDLSVSGMQIQTSNPREIGSRFNISFDLPDKKGKIITSCEVIWVQEYEPLAKKMPAMGIKFVDCSPDSERSLKEFVEKNSSSQ
jgi:uncharacterized protein (TIGR02266 family)